MQSLRAVLVPLACSVFLLHAGPQPAPQAYLQRGLHLAYLYNWIEAAPDFQAAEKGFRAAGDKRNALYAHLGLMRATIERHNLPRASAKLGTELESNALLKSDKQLRMFCLMVKGDIDLEIDTRTARRDWEQVQALAHSLGDKRWENRASAQIGITAFYDGDLQTASKNVGRAVAVAARIHDAGAEIRYTTVLGMALSQAKMYSQALPYFRRALALARKTPDSGYPLFTYEAELEAFIGLQRYGDAQRLGDDMLRHVQTQYRTGGPQVEILPFLARVALARGDVPRAIADLKKSIAICKAAGYQHEQTEPEAMLAEIFRKQGNFPQAEYFAARAAADTQASGDKWSLPQRLQILAQLQVSQGKYTEADRTYDRASAFIDSALANSPSVLEKTALIKASSSLYTEHFALVASRLHNPAKAYSIVEQVRGRVAADLLMSGSVSPQKAKEIEHRLSLLQLRMMSAKSPEQINRLRNRIFSIEESRWVTPGVNILKRKARETVPVATVQRSLDPSTAVLEYVIADPRSYCLAITHDSFRIVTLPGKSSIDELAASYLKSARAKLPAHAEARKLFDALLGPVSKAAYKQKLVIVRDGQLHLFPFDALEDPSGRYVAESHVVAYAPSVTSFYLLRQETTGREDSMGPLLAVGGVPYAQTGLRQISLVRGENPVLGNLPDSTQEVRDANAAIPGHNKLLLGTAATESAFKHAVGRQRYGTIHLAVHGFANDADPNRAALALLPDLAAGEDGFLHASEIAMLHLHANLVVLSACDTAVGPIQGEEGISTLARAFLFAGAKAVVSTLWPVQAASSLLLMSRFYAHIESGEPPAFALADAKRDVLRSFGKAAVPYYWAAYTFEGAPGPAHR
ncbi:MAG TPA: CHAT domain-containing tetratricopeptide repeat protein [Bryobacteraceae bacterium]